MTREQAEEIVYGRYAELFGKGASLEKMPCEDVVELLMEHGE